MNGEPGHPDAEGDLGPVHEPRRRLTIEALGLVLLFVLILIVVLVVFILIRNNDDPEQVASGIEGLLSLGAVLVGAIAGWMGRSALGD